MVCYHIDFEIYTVIQICMDISHSVCIHVDLLIFTKTEHLFCWNKSFHQYSNMASSGLRKLLF